MIVESKAKLVSPSLPLSLHYSRGIAVPCGLPAHGVDSHCPYAHPFGLPVGVAPFPTGSILSSGD